MTSALVSPSSSLLNLSSLRRTPTTTSAVRRRHLRRRHSTRSPTPTSTSAPAIFKLSEDSLQITLKPPTEPLHHLETKLTRFLDFSRDAIDDLRTVVSVESSTGRVTISCRRSTVEFAAAVVFSGLLVVFVLRSLFKVRGSGNKEALVYKRDRSLGGKEVVVGVGTREAASRGMSRRRASANPLGLDSDEDYYYEKRRDGRGSLSVRRRKERLPRWWPTVVDSGGQETENKEEYRRIVNGLIREIMDRKMNGQDISPNDIVQLRHICKTYGVRASIDTANARDSLYRTSVHFVLSYCESMPNVSSSIQINGEEAREFIAGLAHNIGLESAHASRMVSAAVAARTRSRILQAWALEVQNKHSEALTELFKVCLIHHVFPPEEGSAEMEMVAQSLGKTLDLEQRKSILESFISASGSEINRSVVEALGLEGFQDELANQEV